VQTQTTPAAPRDLCKRVPVFSILLFSILLIGGGGLAAWCWPGRSDVAIPGTPIAIMDMPVVQRPLVLSNGEGWLADDEEVLAVSVSGRHRAYRIRALAVVNQHVLNDELGSIPVTVSYCNRSDSCVVFVGAAGQGPLDVAPGGMTGEIDGGNLLLRRGAWHYRQDTTAPLDDNAPPFPYAKATTFERTTWKQWRQAHPDTDLYVGKRPTASQHTEINLVDKPAVRNPVALAAGKARLHNEDEVIGVSANGLHRAYLLRALAKHPVVNDELRGMPVAITYFFGRDCAQVFKGRKPGALDDMAEGGYLSEPEGDSMLLRVGRWRYKQDTGMYLEEHAPVFPYAPAEFERTTWQPWRAAHPDTDVYIGEHRPDLKGADKEKR
jgi:hypothetical protein